MIIWSFQHEEVLRTINEKGIYILKWEDLEKYSRFKNVFECYKDLANYLGYEHCPIWGFYTYNGEVITDEWVDQFKEECYHGGIGVLLKLDIPDELVTLTSYFYWSDYIFYSERLKYEDTEENRKLKEISWNNTFNYKGAERIQAVMPYVRKEWLVGTY